MFLGEVCWLESSKDPEKKEAFLEICLRRLEMDFPRVAGLTLEGSMSSPIAYVGVRNYSRSL